MMPTDSDHRDHQRCEKRSKSKRGFPGWSSGPASEGRRLSGAELEARARSLGADVSPRQVPQRAKADKSGNHKALAVPTLSHDANLGQTKQWSGYARWQHLRLKGQTRFFDIDRPERVA
jgi:hypothetical protein